MSTGHREPMSLADFLAWEERQELPYEFDGLQAIAMTGGGNAHEAVGGNLRTELQTRLRGGRCRVRGPTMKIEVLGRIRYPDAFVFCSNVAASETIIRDPVVVFEVVCPSTSRTDRIAKLREYQATPSIQSYVILEQDAIGATVFSRSGDVWTAKPLTEGDILSMPEIGIDLLLADLYADVPGPEPLEDPAA
jgi:Uma2 family endonuclease